MELITVSKEELRAKVRINRDQHQAIFTEAIEGYRTQTIRLLEEHIERIRKGKPQRVDITMPYPENHTRDYDRVLAMLEMAKGSTVELSEDDFAQYVLDDWSWKRQFLFSNSTYSATATDALRARGEE